MRVVHDRRVSDTNADGGSGADTSSEDVPAPGFGWADMFAEAWATWREEVGSAEKYVAGASDLGLTGERGDVLREVMVHMIEEYARHNGHADFLRERIDGRRGR